MNGITKLEISRYDQISSARPLENAIYKAIQESCDVEIKNKLFITENGDLYSCSTAFLDWYYKAVYNSLADDIVIILDHERRYIRLETDPETPETDIKDIEIPNPYVPPPDERRQMHQEIREHTDALKNLLDELQNTKDKQVLKLNKLEFKLIHIVADIAKISKALFENADKESKT